MLWDFRSEVIERMSGFIRNFFGQLWGLATSDTVSVTVTEPPPPPEEKLTISADKTAIQTGETVTFSGQLTIDGEGESRQVSLYVNGTPVADTMADSAGYYSIEWSTPNTGSYSIHMEG